MTIPLSPASDRRGPRETLLALTEVYLRRGELGDDDRKSVESLDGRAREVRSASAGPPEWAPLAAALGAMLRGEVEQALRIAREALGGVPIPAALRPALLSIGVRAALATDRPALAARWRAGIHGAPTSGMVAPARASRVERHEALPVGDRSFERQVRRRGGLAVLSSMPDEVRVLLEADVDESGVLGSAWVSASLGSDDGGEGPDVEDGADTEGGDAQDSGSPSASKDPDGSVGGGSAGATLHVVMDAYHGDVVSLPAHVEVLSAGSLRTSDEVAMPASEAGIERGAGTSADHATEASQADGFELLTVRVEAGRPLTARPQADAWHVRFVGRLRALDSRTSDGSLLGLAWDDSGFVATIQPPEWFAEFDDTPTVLATRVTHVVVVPENDHGELGRAGPAGR